MSKAKSVVDVILGEAVSGTRSQRLTDMLNIASVIANRATATGVTPEQVVSVQQEFNAYNKALPAGVEKYRDLANQAWQQVQTTGPVNDAMFYATPSAKGNLPGGMQEVGRTDGHVFFSDPQGRSFRVAINGAAQYVQPSAPSPSDAGSAILSAYGAPAGDVASVFDALEANGSGGILEQRAMSPMSADLGPKRPNLPSGNLLDAVQRSVTASLGPDFSTTLFSGQGEHGSSRHRFEDGFAGDFKITDAQGNPITADQSKEVMKTFAGLTGGSTGAGPEYMGPGRIHLDIVPDQLLAANQGKQWGSIGSSIAADLADARKFGYVPDSALHSFTPPVPADKPGQPVMTASVDDVSRETLPPLPSDGQSPILNETSAPEFTSAFFDSNGNVVSAGIDKSRLAGPEPAAVLTDEALNARIAAGAPEPQQPMIDASALGFADPSILTGSFATPDLATFDQVFGNVVLPSAGAPAGLTATPAPPLSPPQQVRQYNVATPQSGANNINAASGMDVWKGLADFGMATDGSTLWRDGADVYRYSPKYDTTQIVTPDGNWHNVSGAKPLPGQGAASKASGAAADKAKSLLDGIMSGLSALASAFGGGSAATAQGGSGSASGNEPGDAGYGGTIPADSAQRIADAEAGGIFGLW